MCQGVWCGEGQNRAAGDLWHGWSSGAVKHGQVPPGGFPRGFQVLHSLENISHPSAAPHLLLFGAGHCTHSSSAGGSSSNHTQGWRKRGFALGAGGHHPLGSEELQNWAERFPLRSCLGWGREQWLPSTSLPWFRVSPQHPCHGSDSSFHATIMDQTCSCCVFVPRWLVDGSKGLLGSTQNTVPSYTR